MFTPPCAGAPPDWEGQCTASIQPIISQERPQCGRKKSKAWGAALLRILSQPFQDLVAWWGLDHNREQYALERSFPAPALLAAPDSGTPEHQHNRGSGWPATPSKHAQLQLQHCQMNIAQPQKQPECIHEHLQQELRTQLPPQGMQLACQDVGMGPRQWKHQQENGEPQSDQALSTAQRWPHSERGPRQVHLLLA